MTLLVIIINIADVSGSFENSEGMLIDWRTEINETGVCFPYRRFIRKVKLIDSSNREQKEAEDLTCNKTAIGKSRLSPGLLLFWCLDCRFCIGMDVRNRKEGPSAVWEALVTRFTKMPSCIVYDNACNLQEYCLFRTASLFKDTQFMVDGFHIKGHVNCPKIVFDATNYEAMKGLSSVTHEQKNAVLARLKSLSPKWSFTSFIEIVMFTIVNQNILEMSHQVKWQDLTSFEFYKEAVAFYQQ